MIVSENPLSALGAFCSQIDIDACAERVVLKARALLLYALAVGVTSSRAPLLRQISAALARE